LTGVIAPRRLSVLVVAAALVAAGAGCGSASPTAATIQFPQQAVAAGATTDDGVSSTTATTTEVRYGDTMTVDRSDFERELKALAANKELEQGGNSLAGAGKKTVDPRVAAQWLNFIIQDALITHEFEQRHLKLSPADTEEGKAQLTAQFGSDAAVAAFPRWFQDRVVARNARGVALRGALSGQDVSEASQRKYYDDHKADFSENCVSHILVKTKAEADAVLARLKGGEDFAAVAQQVSLDPGSKTKGGALDCSPKGSFVPEFDTVASELPVGQLSDPVQTQYGFHILLVRERKEISFDDARPQVRALLNAATQDAVRNFLRQALTSARVTVDKRYGTFEAPGTGQVPTVVPPAVPKPNSQRTDNTPSTEPTPGEEGGIPGSPTQPPG
jgi:parvulin-like peptidyl-prolyl isomerase